MKINSSYVFAAVSLIVTLGLLWFFQELVSYIVIAWILSMVGAPIFNFFNRWLGRSSSAALTLFSFAIILFLLFMVVVPPLVKQARNLAQIDYGSIVDNLEEPMADIDNWMIKRGFKPEPVIDSLSTKEDDLYSDEHIIQTIELDSILGQKDSTGITLLININNPNEPLNEVADQATDSEDLLLKFRNNVLSFFDPSRIPSLFGSAFGFLSSLMIALLSVFFIAFFFLKEQGLFLRMVSAIIPDEYERNADNALTESSKMLIRYFIGVLTQISAITIIVFILLSILGVKNALLIGLFAGIMNVIPYIGPFFGMAFGTFITISSNVNVSFYDGVVPILIKVVVVLGIIQLLDNFILQPTIFSKSVKAHPLEIFLVVLIGAQLGGVGGMVLAIPAYTVIRVLGKVFFGQYKIVRKITGSI